MNTKNIAVLIAVTSLLAACGGGGSDAPSTPAPEPTPAAPAPAPAPATAPVSEVPAATYPTGSEELAAFNLLNAERERCGFGKLAQNGKLDLAARAHADWLMLNNYSGHYETAGTPGFTGVYPWDRMAAAGYASKGTFSGTETNTDRFGSDKTNIGTIGMRNLLSAPYHAVAMVSSYVDIGIAASSTTDVGISTRSASVLNINYAYKNSSGPQLLADQTVATYPCEGSTGVLPSLYGETPNPVPGRNLRTNPLGSSIVVMVRDGSKLVISSAEMTKASTGEAVTVRSPITSDNDPNATPTETYLEKNQGFVIADTPLEEKTAYQVQIKGTNNGIAFSRIFTFTTK